MLATPHLMNSITPALVNKTGKSGYLAISQKAITEFLKENSIINSASDEIINNQRLSIIEDKIRQLLKNNIINLNVDSGVSLNQPESDLVIKMIDEFITEPIDITAKSIEIENANIENVFMVLNSVGDIDINNMTTAGLLPKKQKCDTYSANAQLSISSDDCIKLTNCNFEQSCYNIIEVSLVNGAPKNIIIDNCKFANSSHYVFSFFNWSNHSTFTISNCTFDNIFGLLRLTNRDNNSVTINFVDCVFKNKNPEEELIYSGYVLCQDHISKDFAEFQERNMFSPDKIKINFINCIAPDGKKLDCGTDPAKYSGTHNKNQFIYIYINKGDKGAMPTYNPKIYPEIIFK